MSIQAQGPYANQTTLLSAIGGGGPTPPPTPGANTFSTLNIINIGAGNTPIPSWGINMMPDQNSTAFSNPICFFNARYTSKDTGIPQLQWSDYTSSLNLTTYSASPVYFDLTAASMYLGPNSSDGPPGPLDNSASIGGTGVQNNASVTIPFSSITGVSTINGVDFAALVTKVSTLAG